jgi:hypothetical protein
MVQYGMCGTVSESLPFPSHTPPRDPRDPRPNIYCKNVMGWGDPAIPRPSDLFPNVFRNLQKLARDFSFTIKF